MDGDGPAGLSHCAQLDSRALLYSSRRGAPVPMYLAKLR